MQACDFKIREYKIAKRQIATRQIDATQWAAIVLFVVAYSACAHAVGSAAPDLETIVTRMEQAQAAAHAQVRPYTVTRSYQFFGADRSKANSEVVAQVAYQPPSTKSFTIQKTSGGGQGPKIVRQVLQHESDAAKNASGNMITRQNYDFQLLRSEMRDGQLCYVLQLSPKHSSKDAMRGQAWVDANSYLIRHVEGDLTKSPSWWVKDVHVALDYGRIAGMWLQTATLAVANVRFFGQHSMLAQNIALSVAAPAIAIPSARVSAPRTATISRRARVPIGLAAQMVR